MAPEVIDKAEFLKMCLYKVGLCKKIDSLYYRDVKAGDSINRFSKFRIDFPDFIYLLLFLFFMSDFYVDCGVSFGAIIKWFADS